MLSYSCSVIKIKKMIPKDQPKVMYQEASNYSFGFKQTACSMCRACYKKASAIALKKLYEDEDKRIEAKEDKEKSPFED